MEKIIDEETVKFLKEVDQALTKFDMKLTALKEKLKNDIDYKSILKRYVEHVGLCEGSEFLHTFPESELTNEDIDNIKNLFE